MGPIYKPSGAAAEYGEYALNIYTGCPHSCFYCYAPQALHRERTAFHDHVECQRQCDFVVFRRTGNVGKWRVNMYSL